MARPTSYRKEYAEQARKLCLLGAIDKELADFFEVCPETIDNWKKRHPDFVEALRFGKAGADANVADRLYQRAMGYSHKAVKIFGDPKTGDHLEVSYMEHYPPDTTACIFWLKNRRPDLWRDRHDLQHSGQVDTGVLRVAETIQAAEWEEIARDTQARLFDRSDALAKRLTAGSGDGKGNGTGRGNGKASHGREEGP